MTAGYAKAADSFQACFSKLELAGRSAVIAAVSGGSDSTALLFLLKAHLEHAAPATKLVAVTVDHGMRPDSAAEAASVARLCAQHGIAHRTLSWTGAKPKTGLAAAAREARYRLLAEAAAAAGADIVVTGHTMDDQAETVSMRRRRGAGPGLAGMAPATLYDGQIWGRIWILRPLLQTSRAALREFLRDLGIGWIDDPTNQNMAFERARIRSAGIASADDLNPAVAARILHAQLAAGLVATHASLVSPGLIRLDPEFAGVADREAAIHTLRILLAVTGGTEHLADLARAMALFDRLGDGPLRVTLSRTVIDVRRAGIFLHREGRDLPAPATLHDGMIWDGRFGISVSGDGAAGMIAPLGMENARQVELPETGAPESLMRAALASWPAVWRREDEFGSLTTAPHPPAGTSPSLWLRAFVAGKAEPLAFPPPSADRSSPRPAGRRWLAATLTPPSSRPSRGEGKGEGQRDAELDAVSSATHVTALPLLAPWARFLPSFDLAAAKAVAQLIGARPIPSPPCPGHKDAKA